MLILAGAGGVGHLAVQFANAYGAEVVATASRDNHGFLHGLGASRMVDYHDADWVAQVVAGGQVDLVLDLVGGESGKAALACVKPGGRLVTVPTISAQQIKDAAVSSAIEVLGMLVHPDRQQLSQMLTLLRQGEVQVTVAGEYTLAEGRWPIRPSSRATCVASCCCACPPRTTWPDEWHHRTGARLAVSERLHLRHPAARQLGSAAGAMATKGSGAWPACCCGRRWAIPSAP